MRAQMTTPTAGRACLTTVERCQVVVKARDDAGLRVKLTPVHAPQSTDATRQALIDRTMRFYRRFYRMGRRLT